MAMSIQADLACCRRYVKHHDQDVRTMAELEFPVDQAPQALLELGKTLA